MARSDLDNTLLHTRATGFWLLDLKMGPESVYRERGAGREENWFQMLCFQFQEAVGALIYSNKSNSRSERGQ